MSIEYRLPGELHNELKISCLSFDRAANGDIYIRSNGVPFAMLSADRECLVLVPVRGSSRERCAIMVDDYGYVYTAK